MQKKITRQHAINEGQKRRRGSIHGRARKSQGSSMGEQDQRSLMKNEQKVGPNAGTQLLERLHEVANLMATTEDGRRTFLQDPPMPLMPSCKFSLQPDLAHGWKPDQESLKKIPSLTQFRSPSNQRFAQFQAQTAKAEREALLDEMMKIPGETPQPGAEEDLSEESSEEVANEEESEDENENTQQEKTTGEQRQEKEDVIELNEDSAEPVDQEDSGQVSGAEAADEEREGDEDDGDVVQQQDVTPVKHEQVVQEPEPGPQTPRSNVNTDLAEVRDIQIGNERKSLVDIDQDTGFGLENLQPQMEEISANFKRVHIKRSDRTPDVTKVPLVASFYDPWIAKTYIKNEEEYELVYQRDRYKNSQDLLYHNLKLRSDPLLGNATFNQHTIVLEAASISGNFRIKFGETTVQSQTQQLAQTLYKPSGNGSPLAADEHMQAAHLCFDSEYENGNLELAYLSKSFTDGQKYILLIQNDYNSKGHQQWFNFKMTNLKEDTVYQFVLGPFKKSKSKFGEGMLPWLCDLSKKSDKDSRFPYHKNLASEYISEVEYTSQKKDDGGQMSFLSFKLFIERQSTEYHQQRHFLLAYSEPYTYSRLLNLVNEMQSSGLAKTSKWLNFKVGRLCSSLGGTPLPLLKLTQRQNETILSVYHKPIILVTARVHPGESPSSFLCEGLLRAILNPQNERTVERLLSVAEIHIVPMLNPDGVIVGNSRVNLGGVDMNRRWGKNQLNRNVCPEIQTMKEYMMRHKNQILMYLDLHGHTRGEGIFFYACQPGFSKLDAREKQLDLSVLEKFVLVQALPTTTAKMSPYFNLGKNKYFSMQQDRLGNKLNTGRVVSLNELGIELSYTIECGFNTYTWTEGKLRGKKFALDENAFMQAGADLLSGIINVTFTSLKLQALNKTMIQFLTQKKTRIPGMVIVKQDAFLERLRPLYKSIFNNVKKKLTKIIQLRLQHQLSQANNNAAPEQPAEPKPKLQASYAPRKVISNTISESMHSKKSAFVVDQAGSKDDDGGELQVIGKSNEAMAASGKSMLVIEDKHQQLPGQHLETKQVRKTLQKDSQSSRTQIPILGLTKQGSDQSIRSIGDENNEVFRSTYGVQRDGQTRVNPLDTQLNYFGDSQLTQGRDYDTKLSGVHQMKSMGLGMEQNSKSQSPYRVANHNQTISSMASYSKMEARFTHNNLEPDTQAKHAIDWERVVGGGATTGLDSQLSDESEVSASESDPSEDNMDDFMLKDLHLAVEKQRKVAQRLRKQKMSQKKRKQIFIEQLKNFERHGLDATRASLRQSIERAILGDARSKSQLAEIQTKNHDMTLFALNNSIRSNQFIPNINALQANAKNTKSKLKVAKKRDSSLTVAQDNNTAQQRNEHAFRLTERMSSVYSKSILPDTTHLMMDQQARIDAILENRSRNFDAIKNLTTPSLSLNLSQMNATARVPISKQQRDKEYAALPVNTFKITNAFNQRAARATIQFINESQAGLVANASNPANLKSSGNALPDISTQMKFHGQRNFSNVRSSSITAMYEHQAANLMNQPILDFEQKSQPDLPTTYWKAVPTTLSTLRMNDESNENGPSKSVVTVPLKELISTTLQADNTHVLPHEDAASGAVGKKQQQQQGFMSNSLKRRMSQNDQINELPGGQPALKTSHFYQRKATHENLLHSGVIKLNQFQLMPTGVRPNNRGALITSNNMTPLNVIQRLAQQQTFQTNFVRLDPAQSQLIQAKPQKSASRPALNPLNSHQQHQQTLQTGTSAPHRRVIKVNQQVTTQPEKSGSTRNLHKKQASSSGAQRSYGSFNAEETNSIQYAAMLQQTELLDDVKDTDIKMPATKSQRLVKQVIKQARPTKLIATNKRHKVRKQGASAAPDSGAVEQTNEYDTEKAIDSLGQSPLLRKQTTQMKKESQLREVTETLVDSKLQELPDISTTIIKPQF